eukprot:6171594-Prymnesium_polylepis.2
MPPLQVDPKWCVALHRSGHLAGLHRYQRYAGQRSEPPIPVEAGGVTYSPGDVQLSQWVEPSSASARNCRSESPTHREV